MRKKIIEDKETMQMIRDAEKGKFVPVKNFDEMKAMLKQAAKNTIKARKNKSLTLRISEADLGRLKMKAESQGLPYQTLLTTLIHQYTTDKVKISL